MTKPLRLPAVPIRVRWATADAETKDAAKRIKDAHNLHLVALGTDAVGKYVACHLQDGTGGRDLFDTRAAAERHHDPYRHVFVQVQMSPMDAIEAFIVLSFARDVSRSGRRMAATPNPRPDKRYTTSD